jgi:hypothetical protein
VSGTRLPHARLARHAGRVLSFDRCVIMIEYPHPPQIGRHAL